MGIGTRRMGLGVLVLAVAVTVAGCGGTARDVTGSSGGPASITGVDTATAPRDAASGTAEKAATGPASQAADRSVVRTASLQVRTDGEVLVASRQAASIAQAAGGFVSGENTASDPAHPTKTVSELVLRVPNARLGSVLDQLGALGALLQQRQDATDVTGQVVDLNARLASQRASVERVRALLARATTIGDVVQIEGELARREADLESLEAQVKQLADQTSLATVTVTLVGPDTPAPVEPRPAGFLAGLAAGWHAFTAAGTWLLTAVGAALPFLLLAGLGALVVVAVRRRRPTQAPTPPA
ncbi:MAG TPA: DUF4349 domain-containing protein [Actinomycetes bacterium]